MFFEIETPAGDEVNAGLVKDSFGALYLYTRGAMQKHQGPGWPPPWTLLPSWERIIYSLLTFVPLLITIFLFARRCRNLTQGRIRHMNYIRLLVLLSYILAIAFTFSSLGLILNGIKTIGLCRTGIYLCIGFLFAGKLAMQLFLIERAHVANINYIRRRDDPVWWVSMSFSAVAVIALTVWTYMNPVYFISSEDGRCRNGLPPNVVAPLQAFEITLNTILTIHFVRLLRRAKRNSMAVTIPRKDLAPSKTAEQSTVTLLSTRRNQPSSSISAELANFEITPIAPATTASKEKMSDVEARASGPKDIIEIQVVDLESAPIILPATSGPTRLRTLARKSLVGTLLMLCWSLANNIIFYVTRGRENAWVCFVQCNFDVILSVFVLHWLTADPEEDPTNTSDLRSGLGGDSKLRRASIFTDIPSAREGPLSSRRDSYAKWASRRGTVFSDISEAEMDEMAAKSSPRKASARGHGEEGTTLPFPLAVLALEAWDRRRSSVGTVFGKGPGSKRGSTA